MLFILFILIYPADCVAAAANGLVLWYENILPALLPFTIFSNILIQSGYLNDIIRVCSPFLGRLFFHHPQAAYPIVAGFLFGFPIGSKTTADLLRQGQLTVREADILCAMCNNISPVFVSSYLLSASLGLSGWTWMTYAVLYLPPLFGGLFLLRRQKALPAKKNTASRSNLNFQIIDAGIMNGFETLAKLGGYIILFAILAQMTTLLPISSPIVKCILIGFTEITNGIAYTARQNLEFRLAYPFMMAYTAFGGLSGFAQTASMVKDTGFSMLPYLKIKLLGTALSFGLALLLVQF